MRAAGQDCSSCPTIFFVCPAFAALGAWIGSTFSQNRRAGGYMWLGILAGSVLTFLLARLLSSANRWLLGSARPGVKLLKVA